MPKRISISDFRLESGCNLRDPVIAYDAWGKLNAAGDNAVVVCHSLTSNSDATSWWTDLIGPGRVLDTDRFFVICLNALGSPYGSASPLSTNPDTERPYGAEFPGITIRDTVCAHRRALQALGVQRIALAIGGSMGAMQVLEWGFQGDYVGALIPIAVGGRHSPWGIAWTEAQRRAIYSDPKWNDGMYPADDPPAEGLAAARMMAMISYRTAGEFDDRFGRNASTDFEPGFSVESYLRHQGKKLVDRFDANCYVHLTRQMNTHDVARDRGRYPEILCELTQPTLVIGISSDVLYPLHEQQELVAEIPNAELIVLRAPYGHDSFLVEADRLADLIEPFVEKWAGAPERSPSNPNRTGVRVLKFGGSSVGDPDAIRRVVEIIKKSARLYRPIVVVSALASVTNALETLLRNQQQDRTALLIDLYRRHMETARQLLSSSALVSYRSALGDELASIMPALRRINQRMHTRFDHERILAAGERFSAPLIAAVLQDAGYAARPIDAATLIRVSDVEDADVELTTTYGLIRTWYERTSIDEIPVVTGFIAAAPCGRTVTLGRGGSDFTAALIASALGANLLERWTDVDGLFSEDPNCSTDARQFQVLRMEDAEILCSASRLGMHRHTLTPLLSSRIPLRVRSLKTGGAGTLVIPSSQNLPERQLSV